MATLLALPVGLVTRAHTALSVLAFSAALALGYAAGLWEALCENAVAGWPIEWFPSVSATIGDHAASRAPFHILIALTAGPRFALLGLQWLAHRYPPAGHGQAAGAGATSSTSAVKDNGSATRRRTRSASAKLADGNGAEKDHHDGELMPAPSGLVDVEVLCGLARTFCWWLHDLFMILYLVLNVPWMVLSILHSTNDRARRWRIGTGLGFLASIPPLIYLFIEHSVKHVPGAYTRYAFFEWALVIWDVAFDAGTILELDHLQLRIVDTSRSEDGKTGSSSEGLFLAPTVQKPRSAVDWTALPSPPSKLPFRNMLAWFSDVWFAAVFWTTFTSVSVQLFYWSVWSLALTGSELAIFINIQPFMFNSASSREWYTSRQGIFTNRTILYVLGLGCYALPVNSARFLCALYACWCGWAAFLGDSIRLRGSPEAYANGKIFMTGLLLTTLLKYINHSNNPFWPLLDETSGGWNKTGLLISALAIAETYYRPNNLFASPPATVKDKPAAAVATTRTQRICLAFGLGSLFHLLQTFVMDAGTIISWTWTGYPVTGPMLHPWGGVVIAVATLALAVDLPVLNPALYLVPFPAAAALVIYPDWAGFIGGLVLVFYIVAIAPALLRAATAMPPSTWGQAMCWNAFLDVASVFTVAYAFVPYGWLLRERTDLITLIILLPLPPALWAASTLHLPGKEQLQPRSVSRVALSSKWTKIAAVLLGIASLAVGYERNSVSASETNKPVPYYPDYNIISGGIFTVHFGIDEPGRDSQRRIAQLIEEMEVDVLGMLETDLHRFVYGNRDLTRYIAEELGYYVDLGPGPNKHTWGACLLSKFPILNSTHHLLPSPNGELAPAIHATLDVHGQHINVIVSHNGQEEDPLDREQQTTELARLLHETGDAPTMFLGYLVTHLFDEPPSPYGILFNRTHTGLQDIETLDSWRWCEYLGFRGLWRIAYGRLEHSDVTDTELQVGKFILPLPGQKAVYNSDEELYWHVGEAQVPEPWRLPALFRGDGVRGHAYRVWDGPLYYNPPLHSGVREYGWNNNTQWPPSFTGEFPNSN